MIAGKNARTLNQLHEKATRSRRAVEMANECWIAHNKMYETELDAFILRTARDAGLTKLSPSAIDAGIREVARKGRDPDIVAEWTTKDACAEPSAEPKPSRTIKSRSRRPGPGQVVVQIEVTKAAGEQNTTLNRLGFVWNGRSNRYRAVVDDTALPDLRGEFVDLLSEQHQGGSGPVVQSSGLTDVPPSVAVKALPDIASATLSSPLHEPKIFSGVLADPAQSNDPQDHENGQCILAANHKQTIPPPPIAAADILDALSETIASDAQSTGHVSVDFSPPRASGVQQLKPVSPFSPFRPGYSPSTSSMEDNESS